MKSKLFIFCYTVLCLCILNNTFPTRHQEILTQDKSGYHLYLPAAFIYHDLSHLSFYPDIQEKYHPTSDIKWSGLHDRPDGRRINKYAIGVSVMELPFFLVAHAYTQSTHKYEADGYSIPYRAAAAISNIFWCIIGLVFLRLLLKRYFNDTTVLITLACVALGTNLYYQTVFDGGSHVYCFFLVACALSYTDKWYTNTKTSDLFKLALTLGFLVITRPVDILIVLVVIFWKVYNRTTLTVRIKMLSRHIPKLLIAFILFLAVASIQMSYWKYVTGQWIFYSYEAERFDFLNPHVGKGLFSFRKGWFIYTPMAAISCIGFYYLWRQYKSLAAAITATFLVIVYVVFSWTGWWYGGSFSARPMIDFIPLLCLPLAALIEGILKWAPFTKAASFILLFAFITLNIFQSYQFSKNIIHYDRMTAAYYWRVFGKITVTEEDKEYLMSDREYWKAMSEAYD